ncbi:hypothetical protein BDV41DRAFT_535874 [Aspergillus transmontanensis]|uniref:Uncharacterized protein n=1 Tax=Aspergillus transmontanensis TaxID=1034304 RepID=A0A5N6VYK6_9EURO|nr:hypothetical protein BDV41DRAFT_535874 [Aspergillus transmontanensis]
MLRKVIALMILVYSIGFILWVSHHSIAHFHYLRLYMSLLHLFFASCVAIVLLRKH